MLAKEKFEALAASWDQQGRPYAKLLGGYSLITLRCWSYSDGGKADGLSALLQTYLSESEAAQNKNWLDAYFSEPENCASCGERYRFENISFCTHCRRGACYSCAGKGGKAANGNRACGCGGELVG